MKRIFFHFLSKYNLLQHFSVFLCSYLFISLIYAWLLALFADGISFSMVTSWLLGVWLPDVDVKMLGGVFPYAKSIFISFTSILILVWQSVLIAKLLNRPDYIHLSDVITYYESDVHDSGNDFIVFRLNNEGYDALYNVKICATLRFFDQETETLQHYGCQLRNPSIPILSPNMPFRVYIECVPIKTAIRTIVLDPIGKRVGLKETVVTVLDEKRIYRDENITRSELVVFVSGYDIELDQEKSVSMTFTIRDMKYGKFIGIHSSASKDGSMRFDSHEIKLKFNTVESNGEWPVQYSLANDN